jgi:2,3-bisphosphoglycerate-dependent phosphoglycerate mutase
MAASPASPLAPARAEKGRGSVLALVRHGESDWNRRNLFTGWRDPDLTAKGIAEAHEAGRLLKRERIAFDAAYTSALKRAQHTLTIILEELGQTALPTHADARLNERDYGELSGLNKDDARKRWGAEQVHVWRRSYDVRPPGGESLKDTAERVLPYWQAQIRPEIVAGRNVLVAAHGNSLRALIMRLEGLTGEEIIARELATGAPIIYLMAGDAEVRERRELA